MQYRVFGNTGEKVSAVGFGGAAISGEGRGYGFGAMTEDDAIELCHQCIDAGINLFDTAPIYGYGVSEQRMGKALKGRRDEVFLVSKCGITWDDSRRIRRDNDPKLALAMLDQSLKNLQTDYLDLYLVHWPDKSVDIRETVAALQTAREAGKIRHIGLSNSFPEDIEKAAEVTELAVLQSEFNLFSRYPSESLFSIAKERNLGFMSWGTLDKGILTGRVTAERKFDKHDLRSRVPWWTKADRAPTYAAMKRIEPLLNDGGHSGLELALGFVLSFEESSTALCGVKSKEQLDSAVDALNNLPTQSLLDEALAIAEEEVGSTASIK